MTSERPDERLRALERCWRTSGDPRDEASYLLERVRVGELTPKQLRVLAYLAHPAAIVALGRAAPTPGSRPSSILQAIGRESAAIALAAAMAAVEASSCAASMALAVARTRVYLASPGLRDSEQALAEVWLQASGVELFLKGPPDAWTIIGLVGQIRGRGVEPSVAAVARAEAIRLLLFGDPRRG